MRDLKTWIKLGSVFIDQHNVRSMKRQGEGTLVERLNGEDIFVEISYDKVREAFPSVVAGDDEI